MSLLFDALKRARDNDALPLSGKAATDQAKTPAALKYSLVLPGLAGGLLLAAACYIFLQYRHAPIPALAPVLQLAAAAPSAPASAVVAMNTLPAKAVGNLTYSLKQNDRTYPVKAKKHHAKNRHPYTQPVLPAESDPLKDGYLALLAGNLPLAEQKYLKALVLHPYEKDALLGLAIVAQRKMQKDRAISLYRQVLREDLGNTTAAAALISLASTADPLAAESQLKELIELKPASAEFHYAMGNVLARQLRWAEAQQAFFHAYTLSPDNALFAYNLAVALDRLHQPAAALPYYRQAAKLANDPILDMDAINKRIEELNVSG